MDYPGPPGGHRRKKVSAGMGLLEELWRKSRLDYFSDLKGERNLPRVISVLVTMRGYQLEEWNEAVRYLFGLPDQPDFKNEEEARDYCKKLQERGERKKEESDGEQRTEMRNRWRKKRGILRPPDSG